MIGNNEPHPDNPDNTMNHTHVNHVKFTGSAFESPSDAATILLQFILLLMIIFGIDIVRN